MRIVQVLTRGDVVGGAQTHVRELSLELQKLGHTVTVITGKPGIFTAQLRQAGIPWIEAASLARPLRPHRDLAALVQLCRVIGALQPDLVCAHTAKAGALGRAAARVQGIPSVYTPHGWSMLDRGTLRPRPLFLWAEWMAARLGTRVINVCQSERQYARKFAICPADALEVVHNGIADSSRTRTRPVETQPPLIVMVARFAAQKDHGTLLQALRGLLALEWNLALIGGGELERQVIVQAEQLGLSHRMRILPPHTDVEGLLLQAQIFALSTHFEAFPISILEAMRAGMPVVATDTGGIREAVHHGETGLLTRHSDVEDLRQALARVISGPALRASLGSAGRALWSRHFTAATMASRTLEVYRRALNRDAARMAVAENAAGVAG